MNIAVIGIGGVGGYFGGKLTQLLSDERDLNIFFVARNQHLKEIITNGLILDTDEGQMICRPTEATDNISGLPQLDICLVCVKSYDLHNVLVCLQPKIKKDTMILPLLNGVDIYERIRPMITSGIVFPACVYVGTHIEKPGTVCQRGGACMIYFGNDPDKPVADPPLLDLFTRAGIKYNWTANPYTEIWSKYIFIASFGMVTANFNKTIGEVMESDELKGYTKRIMSEIYDIAERKQIMLPASIVDDSFAKGSKFPYETKTSFQRDYENKNRPDERDLFGDTIIRLGLQLGIKTETTEMIHHSLQENKVLL